jgi:putative membrane fusion protein
MTLGAVLIFLLLMLIAYETAGLTRSLLLRWIISVDKIETETIIDTVPVDGLLIKEEFLFRSPINGNVSLTAQDGERISKGTVVAEVKALSLDTPSGSTNHQLFAPKSGSLCTHIDGLEEVLNPSTVDVLDLSQVGTIRKELSTDNSTKGTVDSGQVVAKLIDNLQPILICMEINADAFTKEYLQAGNKVRVKYKDHIFSAKVTKTETLQQKQSILLSVSSYPEEIIHLRSTQFELIKDQLSGILVPEDTLIYRDGKAGLYIIYERNIKWIPVEIEGNLHNKVMINSSDLKSGIRYITNPQVILEGDRIY